MGGAPPRRTPPRAPPGVLIAQDLREWIALLEREGELVRVAEAGGVPAVAALAELIARCAAERADGRPDDGAAWVDAARALGGAPDDDTVADALARHSARVAP